MLLESQAYRLRRVRPRVRRPADDVRRGIDHGDPTVGLAPHGAHRVDHRLERHALSKGAGETHMEDARAVDVGRLESRT